MAKSDEAYKRAMRNAEARKDDPNFQYLMEQIAEIAADNDLPDHISRNRIENITKKLWGR